MNKNMKAVLTCLSCAGVLGTTACAIYDTEKHSDNKLGLKEYAKTYWKDYIPTLILSTATVGSIITNHVLTTKDIKSLAALSAGTTALLADYKDEIKNKFGEEGYKEVVKGVAEKRKGVQEAKGHCITVQNLCSTSTEVIEEPTTLFYDEFSDTWFYSTLFNVKNAMYHYNRNFNLRGEASVDEFYEFLGITPTMQWPKDLYGFGLNLLEDGINWIDFDICECESKDGEKFYSIFFDYQPVEYNEAECTYAYKDE